ncbi:MAG TPA: nitrogen fixation protein FixH [Variovorax sp.]|nr:nitrogen fixation protein FixH [Variovorax sp.]
MNSQTDAPWWKFPLMWLVIGLPACVVLAGLGTVWIALQTPDSVLDSPTQRSLAPAQAGRNHAMTPGTSLPLAQGGRTKERP